MKNGLLGVIVTAYNLAIAMMNKVLANTDWAKLATIVGVVAGLATAFYYFIAGIRMIIEMFRGWSKDDNEYVD